MNRADVWFNRMRVEHPVVLWFGVVLPIQVALMLGSLFALAVGIKAGWIK